MSPPAAIPRTAKPPTHGVEEPRKLALPPAQGPADPGPLHRGLVSLVLPAKNEEAGIGDTLRALPLATLAAQGFRHEVVVLDGGSEDGTRPIAERWGARVLGQREPGKGAAVREALPHLAGDYVIMLDADATYAPDAIPAVVDLLATGEADVVMGSRRRGWRAPGAMGRANAVGNRLLSAAASLIYLRRCTDVCTGLWGFHRDALRALPLQSRGFELEAELFGRAARAGLRVREVPVDYLPRRGGTKLSKGRDGARIAWWLLRTRFAPAPRAARRAPSPSEPEGAHPRTEEVEA